MQRRFSLMIVILGLLSAPGYGAAPNKIWYVDADSQASNPDGLSWVTAFPSLQQALGQTDNLDTTVEHIYVANGIYKPGTSSASSFIMKNTVEVYGGFQGAVWPGGTGGEPDLASRPRDSDPHTVDPSEDSVLSGDLNGDDSVTDWLAFWDCYCTRMNCVQSGCAQFDLDGNGKIDLSDANMTENSDHVVEFPGGTQLLKALLDGFSIVQGNSRMAAGDVFSGGPGIHFEAGQGTVHNCTLQHHFSISGNGGAIFAGDGETMGGHFSQLVISENLTGHGSFGGKAVENTWIVNSEIIDNRSFDGLGTGLWLEGGKDFRVRIINTLIARNKDRFVDANGPGIALLGGLALTISNCTIVDNDGGTGEGGGLFVDTGDNFNQNWPSVLIENSIIWGNTAGTGQQIFELRRGDNSVLIQHSNIRQFAPNDVSASSGDLVFLGSANLGTTAADDPLFVNPTGLVPDYKLQASSPSVDAAMIGLIQPDTVDLDGDGDVFEQTPFDLARGPRRVDELSSPDCSQAIGACGAWPVPDMGAYELATDCNSNGLVDSEEIGIISEVSDSRLYPVSDQTADVTSRRFGSAVAVSGDHAAVSGPGMFVNFQPGAGVVHTFTFTNGAWVRDSQDIPNPAPSSNGGYGSSLAMSGDLLIIGAPLAGVGGDADIYRLNSTSGLWEFEQELTYANPQAQGAFGAAVDIDASTGVAIVGASLKDNGQPGGLGVAFLYRWDPALSTWADDGQLNHPGGSTNPQFGASVAIEGNIAVVGAPRSDPGALTNAGEAFVFAYDGAMWNSSATLTASDVSSESLFGWSLDITDGRIVVGAPFRDEPGMVGVGAAYSFTFDGLVWTQEAKLPLPPSAAAGDAFGWSTAIYHSDKIGVDADRSVIVVGSIWEDAIGQNSGAAHAYFVESGGAITHRRTLLAPSGTADDNAGATVAVFGDRFLIGATGDRFDGVANDGPISMGSAYLTKAFTNDENNNGILDECEAGAVRPEPLLAGGTDDANRFVSISLPSSPEPNFALRLRIVSIHDPAPSNIAAFPAPAAYDLGGAIRWIGPAQDCLDSPAFGTTYKCASLQCTPYYTDWQTALAGESLYIYGTDIAPDSIYEVEVVDDTCVGIESTCTVVSVPLKVRTARWGDVAAPFQDRTMQSPSQPNVLDITGVVDGVKGVVGSPREFQTLLRSELVDPAGSTTSVLDVTIVVDGIKGQSYSYPITPTCAP